MISDYLPDDQVINQQQVLILHIWLDDVKVESKRKGKKSYPDFENPIWDQMTEFWAIGWRLKLYLPRKKFKEYTRETPMVQ